MFCVCILFVHHSTYAQINLQWQTRNDLNPNLPKSVQIFEFDGNLPTTNRKVHIFYAKIDLKDKDIELKSIASEQGKGLEITPDLAVKNDAILAINGGYFTFKPDTAHGGLSSVSLLISESKILTTNQLSVIRKNKNDETMLCYPTRSAFGMNGKKLDIAWVYSEQGKTYFYERPNPISDNLEQTPPSKNVPSKRKKWKMKEVMGGGPVLVENFTKKITDKEELFAQIAGVNPRTAVGYTAAREVIFLVVDGRQSQSEGVTFEELAEIFVGLGAKEAINLDGGGSSTFWADGKVINSPSDKTGLRKVASVLIIRRKKK